MEQKEKKKKKSSTAKGERTLREQEAAVTENEDSNMTWFIFLVMFQVIFSYCPRETRISLEFILQASSRNESLGFQVNVVGFLLFQKWKVCQNSVSL